MYTPKEEPAIKLNSERTRVDWNALERKLELFMKGAIGPDTEVAKVMRLGIHLVPFDDQGLTPCRPFQQSTCL